jgi:hypothetical protein
MSNETTRNEEHEHAARRTLDVAIEAQAGAPNPIDPETITLNNSVLRVVWRCSDLPPDTRLQIVFPEDPRGPFVRLESTGNEVIGWGNRGPAETSRHYVYEARLQTGLGEALVGAGTLKNSATKPILSPTTSYPPPPPPDEQAQ